MPTEAEALAEGYRIGAAEIATGMRRDGCPCVALYQGRLGRQLLLRSEFAGDGRYGIVLALPRGQGSKMRAIAAGDEIWFLLAELSCTPDQRPSADSSQVQKLRARGKPAVLAAVGRDRADAVLALAELLPSPTHWTDPTWRNPYTEARRADCLARGVRRPA